MQSTAPAWKDWCSNHQVFNRLLSPLCLRACLLSCLLAPSFRQGSRKSLVYFELKLNALIPFSARALDLISRESLVLLPPCTIISESFFTSAEEIILACRAREPLLRCVCYSITLVRTHGILVMQSFPCPPTTPISTSSSSPSSHSCAPLSTLAEHSSETYGWCVSLCYHPPLLFLSANLILLFTNNLRCLFNADQLLLHLPLRIRMDCRQVF